MKQEDVNPFARQRFFNRASQASWRAFAAHRDQVTFRLEAAGAPSRSLCVLGAGNCNDLDLVRLTSCWGKIRLVDIDAEAMQAGVMNQLLAAGVSERKGQIEFSACDLTGALEHCHEIAQAPSAEGLARLRGALALPPPVGQLGGPYAAVASTCLLSQLIGIFRRAVGESSPELRGLTELVRIQHLRTLAELTAPGGTVLLFTDFVSSDTHPELLGAPVGALPAIMDKVLREHGCFTGMNPLLIRRLLGEAPLASYWAGPPAISAPWVWDLGPRSYLVTAITCRRKSGAPQGGAGLV